MSNSFTPTQCPICDTGLWLPMADGRFTFRHGRKEHFVGNQNYAKCNNCGAEGFLPGQRAANDASVRDFQRKLPGYISPSDVLAVREKYMLTQEQAGLIFGGGTQAFSKWECGKTQPAGPTGRLLQLALKSDSTMRELAAQVNVELPNFLPANVVERRAIPRVAPSPPTYRFKRILDVPSSAPPMDVFVVMPERQLLIISIGAVINMDSGSDELVTNLPALAPHLPWHDIVRFAGATQRETLEQAKPPAYEIEHGTAPTIH